MKVLATGANGHQATNLVAELPAAGLTMGGEARANVSAKVARPSPYVRSLPSDCSGMTDPRCRHRRLGSPGTPLIITRKPWAENSTASWRR